MVHDVQDRPTFYILLRKHDGDPHGKKKTKERPCKKRAPDPRRGGTTLGYGYAAIVRELILVLALPEYPGGYPISALIKS